MATVYAVAFSGDRFLMVFNEKRAGWEMPGGRIEEGESAEDAAKREFLEEAGYEIKIVKTMDIGHCLVCACLLLGKVNDSPEMSSELFAEIPADTAFERSEYEYVVPQARSAVRSRTMCKGSSL
ncbi:MAG: NUDIX domain-containing protein [Candidatus Methanoplasma sp.]|jgi:8-oxo-dGTP diphosphatase|nr:NUDIX domain-containing protein [Candidatus Methanoplasma sp.]